MPTENSNETKYRKYSAAESEHKKYSTRRIRRMQNAAMQRFFSEPTSFVEARERGLNYYWDTEG